MVGTMSAFLTVVLFLFVTSVLLSCIDNDYSLYCVCCFVCSAVCLGGVVATLCCMSYVLFLVSAFLL